jgi:hypothetical protein
MKLNKISKFLNIFSKIRSNFSENTEIVAIVDKNNNLIGKATRKEMRIN